MSTSSKDEGRKRKKVAVKAASDGGDFMENQIINVPTLENGVVAMGDLWDCRTCTATGNLFEKTLTAEHLEANIISTLDYKLTHLKSNRDYFNKLNISASLSFEMLLGDETKPPGDKIKVTGTANYDNKEKNTFKSENIDCTYKAVTYQVRIRPTVKDVVSRDVTENIVAGRIQATHFVQAISLGGQANASIKVMEKIDASKMSLSGNLTANLKMGPITVDAQVSMEMLDNSLSEDYETTIEVHSQPRLGNSPVNVTEMFEEIKQLDELTKQELHFPQLNTEGKLVCGVPIGFRLVPLAQLIDFETEQLYRMMAEDLMNDFQSMLFTLQDFSDVNYLKSLLRQEVPALVMILSDDSNALTKEVMAKAAELSIIARRIKQEAFLVFTEFKLKRKTEEDMAAIIKKYDDEFEITKVMAQILDFKEQGKRELSGVRASDVDGLVGGDGAPTIRFFSNEIDMKDWYAPERSIKILLQTNSDNGSPSGVFLKLFDMSVTLAKLGVEVGIAFPNVSKDFSVSYKTQYKETIVQKEDIPFFFEVLGIAIDEGRPMSTIFYSLNAVLSGLQVPMQDFLFDIPSLVTVMREYQGTIVSETYCDLLSRLTETMTSWDFVLPVQAANTGIEMMRFFRQLRQYIPEKFPDTKHRWIMSKFNVENQFSSPLLFVFRDGLLQAICLDHLDILILLDELARPIPNFSLLSHKTVREGCLYVPRGDFAIDVMQNLVLDHSSSITDTMKGLEMFPSVPNEPLEDATKITRAACLRNNATVLSEIARLAISKNKDLEAVLEKFGWSDGAFQAVDVWDDERRKELAKEIIDFIGSFSPVLNKVILGIEELKNLLNAEGEGELTDEQLNAKLDLIINFLIVPESRRVQSYEWRGREIDEDAELKKLKDVVLSYANSTASVRRHGITKAFEEFYKEYTDDEEYLHICQLLALVTGMKDGGDISHFFINLTKKYVGRIALNENDDLYPRAKGKLDKSLVERQLFKTLDILTQISYHPLLYIVHQEFFNLTALPSPTVTKSTIEKFTTLLFDDEQLEAMWINPKFLFMLRQVVDNKGVLETLYVHIQSCYNQDSAALLDFDTESFDGEIMASAQPIFPSFIPADIVAKVKPLFAEKGGPEFDWIKEWVDVPTLVEQLQILTVRKVIPSDFPEIFRENIEKNQEIREAMKNSGCLFYWDEENQYFKQPWSIATIAKAMEILMATLKPKLSLNKKTTKVTVSNAAGGEEDFTIEVNDTWKKFIATGKLDSVSFNKFLLMKRLQPIALKEYEEAGSAAEIIFSYVLQQAKMLNPTVLSPKVVFKFINYQLSGLRPGQIDFGDGLSNGGLGHIITRGDIQTALLHIVDPFVVHNIFVSMINGPIALPLIVTGIESETATPKSRLLFPSIKSLIVPEMEGLVPQPHLFKTPFRFVMTLRVGDTNPDFGRSSLINDLLLKDLNIFSSFNEPGKNFGKPLNRTGFTEFTWLSPTTCEGQFWSDVIKPEYESQRSEMILLGNLHGDALQLGSLFEILKPLVSCYVVFWKVSNWNELKLKKKALSTLMGGGIETLDLILYPDASIIGQVHEQNLIHRVEVQSNGRSAEVNRAKLQRIFKEAIRHSLKLDGNLNNDPEPNIVVRNTSSLLSFAGLGGKGAKLVPTVAPTQMDVQPQLPTEESTKLLQFIENNTIGNIKLAIKEQNQDLIQVFVDVITPLFALPLQKRVNALQHVVYELDYLSRRSSGRIVQRIFKLRGQIEDQFLHKTPSQDWIIEVQEEIKASLDQLYLNTMSIHDIFRLLTSQIEPTEEFIQVCYENLSCGFALELFHPTYGHAMWELPTRNILTSIPENTRIFVVSVVGLKRSGKSMLLNRLFGQGFTESSTTLGLQMRLLWCSEELKFDLDCDAFLIVDSEGLGAAENKLDEGADIWERKLVTLLLGMSDVSIGNVLGPSMKELSSIFEISLTALSKINDLLLKPDVLLVQQLIQGQQETKLEFENSLQEVRNFTKTRELEIGLRVREAHRLQTIKSRVKHKEIIHQIRPFGNDFEENSDYQEDIQSLYNQLIDRCLVSRQRRLTFGPWYEYTNRLWNDIETINFHFQFQNVKGIEESLVLDDKILALNKAVDAAYMYHEKIAYEKFNQYVNSVFEDNKEPYDENLQLAMQNAMIYLKAVINTCEDKGKGSEGGEGARRRRQRAAAVNPNACDACVVAFGLKESLYADISGRPRSFLIVEQVEDYITGVRDSILQRMQQTITARQIKEGKSEEMSKVLHDLDDNNDKPWPVQVLWMKFQQYISTKQTVIPARHRFKAEIDELYRSLPNVTQRLTDQGPWDFPNLETLPAFDVEQYNSALESSLNSPKPVKLTWLQNDWLVTRLEDITPKMMLDLEANIYKVGMARELRQRIQNTITLFEEYCGEKLLPNFAWKVHTYGIQQFGRFIESQQAEWDEENNPLVQLQKRESDFPEIFE